MKAVVLKAKNVLIVEEVPEPVVGPYDALCDVLSASICSGTDNNIVNNHLFHKVTFPLILGHEGIGRVTKIGEKVKNLKPGDLVTRVFGKLPSDSQYKLMWGAFAQRAIVTDWQAMRDDGLPESSFKAFTVHRVLPPDFDPVASTMIITWRETYSYLAQIGVSPGTSMIIIGSGANALAFADHARNLGVQAYVVGGKGREESFRKAGVSGYYLYSDPNLFEKIKGQTPGVEFIIDAIGNANTTNTLLPLLKSNGTIGLYGLDDFEDYSLSPTKTQGSFSFVPGVSYDEGSAHDAIVGYIQSGKLDAWDYLSKDHIYPLEKVVEAITASREQRVLKSVLSILE